MKLFAGILFLFVSSLGMAQSSDFTFEKRTIKLSSMTDGEKTSFQFHFTNTSNENIVIESMETCHCTTATFPKEAIPPNGKGTIDVVFDATDMVGWNEPVLDIWYGKPAPYKIRFKVNVKAKKEKPKKN